MDNVHFEVARPLDHLRSQLRKINVYLIKNNRLALVGKMATIAFVVDSHIFS